MAWRPARWTCSNLPVVGLPVIVLCFYAAMYPPPASFIVGVFATKIGRSGAPKGYGLAGVLGQALAPIISVAMLEGLDTLLVVSPCVVVAPALTTACDPLAAET